MYSWYHLLVNYTKRHNIISGKDYRFTYLLKARVWRNKGTSNSNCTVFPVLQNIQKRLYDAFVR